MAAWAGIIAPILFTFLVAVESILRQGYSQISNYVSELGVGSYAIIQNTNFIIFLNLITSQLLTWRALKNGDDTLWGHYRTYSLVSGLVALPLLFVIIYTLGTAYHGATERAFIAVPLIWLARTGMKLESIAKIKQTQEVTPRKATEKESKGPQATALGIDHSPEEIEDENAQEYEH